MREKITTDLKRYKKFQQMLLGDDTKISVKDIDIRNYAKVILLEGDTKEKRDFLRCLKSTVVLEKKIVRLA